ncbi:MAG: dihydrodipicolinate synthase family protein [Candidatus Ranarchaeia archaeon]
MKKTEAELVSQLKGVMPTTITPFTKDDQLDVEGIIKNIDYLRRKGKGKDMVVVCATSIGEFYALSREEHYQVVETVVEAVDSEFPIIAGTGHTGTKEALVLSKKADDLGVDYVMVSLPYYHIPSEEGLYKHFKTIADGIECGLIVYNNPGTSKCYIRPPLMQKLAEIPNIVGVKETYPGIMPFFWMKRLVDPKKCAVLCGWGDLYYSFEALYQTPGFFSVSAVFAPDHSFALYEAAQRGDLAAIRQAIENMMPFIEFYRKITMNRSPSTSILPEHFPKNMIILSVIKSALDHLGLHGGHVRLPIDNLSENEKTELKAVMKKMGLPV